MRLMIGSLVLLAGLAGCGSASDTSVQAAPAAAPSASTARPDRGWVELAAPPTGARRDYVVAWTGREALFLGGSTHPGCGPGADCAVPPSRTRDGAALDPEAGTWRATADAPVPLPVGSSSAVLSDRVYVWTGADFLAYDAPADEWATLPDPPTTGVARADGRLVATADRVLFVAGSHERTDRPVPDLGYDPATRAWSELPIDPLGASYDRLAVWTRDGLVLTGKELVDSPGSAKPSIVRAARLDADGKGWTRLADSDQIGGWRYSWTGTHIVDPSIGGADGGKVGGWGRTVPYGGRLDPATGEWDRLPDAPADRGGWAVEAVTGGPRTAADGWVYDDSDGSWTRLTAPAGAPVEPGSAVWAGEDLIVVGGLDVENLALSGRAWAYRAR